MCSSPLPCLSSFFLLHADLCTENARTLNHAVLAVRTYVNTARSTAKDRMQAETETNFIMIIELGTNVRTPGSKNSNYASRQNKFKKL